MNVRSQKSSRRRGQAMLRTVLGIGTVVAGALGYLVSDTGRVEATIVPVLVMGLFVFGVALNGRARARREWTAAWDAYAEREGTRKAAGPSRAHEAFA
jgi:hypothetical protein